MKPEAIFFITALLLAAAYLLGRALLEADLALAPVGGYGALHLSALALRAYRGRR